ncbi:hypothetical protein EG832_02815, partial [bacterium]|nr:hypothetical protein [bacterium]
MISKKMTRFFRILLIAAFVAPCLSTAAFAASYYVDSVSGNDTNAGSLSAPWKTVAKVNGRSFTAGDTIYFKCGGIWNEGLRPVSGVSGSPVVYSSYGSGTKPVIDRCDLTNKSYVRLQSISFISQSNYPLNLYNSTYNDIENCDIIADVNNTAAWAALFIQMNSHHNKIINCTIERRNTNSQGDAVNLIRNANYNLILGNKIGTATHYALSLEGSNGSYPTYVCSYNIIRNNTINNAHGGQYAAVSNSNRNVVDGNTIAGGKSSSYSNNADHSLKNVSSYNIIRRNVVTNNTDSNSWGISSVAYQYNSEPANNVVANRIYNNVVANIYANAVVIDNYLPSVCQVSNNVYRNNIFFNNGAGNNGLQFKITSYVSGPTYLNNNI